MKKLLQIFIVTFLLIANVLISYADQINDYRSEITVQKDGTIDVVETIEITTSHEEIRLGITRDIPTAYYFMQKRIEAPVNVLSVTRNEQEENFWTERNNGFVEIFTGSVDNVVDNYLDKGKHTFVIHWQSENHIRSFEEYDELYFNAIGHNWRLPILKAKVTLHLPKSVNAIQSAAYYGQYGENKRGEVVQKSPQIIEFIAPTIIGNGSGFTIATGFTKGIVPSIAADKKDIIMDKILGDFPVFIQPVNIVLFGMLLVILAYTFLGYILHKRHSVRSQRAFMVRYSPPENLTIDDVFALSHLNVNSISTDKGTLALLVDLNAKGCITIDRENQQFIVNPSKISVESISPIQGQFLESIIAEHELTLSYKSPNTLLIKSLRKMAQQLSSLAIQCYEKVLYGFWKFGYVLLAIMAFSAQIYLPIEMYMALIFTMIASFKLIAPTLLHYISPESDDDENAGIIGIIFGSIFGAVPLFGMQNEILDIPLSILGFVAFYSATLIPLILIGICLLIIKRWAYGLKPEYIEDQQAVLEFQHFLTYTKKEEYALITPELFEEYLAYAIIFGVDQNWLTLYRTLYPAQFNGSNINGRAAFYSATQSSGFMNGTSSVGSSSHSGSRGGYGGSRGSGGSGSGGGGSSGGGSGGGGGGGR